MIGKDSGLFNRLDCDCKRKKKPLWGCPFGCHRYQEKAKKSIYIYLNSLANNCALVLQSRHCIQFNFYNEGTEIEDLSLCGFSPLYTKKTGTKVTMKIREQDVSHMQRFQQLEPSACLLDWNVHRDGYVLRSKLGSQMRRGPHMRWPKDDVLADSESGRFRGFRTYLLLDQHLHTSRRGSCTSPGIHLAVGG